MSPGRDFLYEMLENYPQVPLVLTEPAGQSYTQEERISYYRRGVVGFLSLKADGYNQRIQTYTSSLFQQNALSQLARANRLLQFETGQRILTDGKTAEIVLFDFRMKKAVKAADTDNILSLLSTPDVHFDQVIGADDAKQELRFFLSYMNNPKRYHRQGASAPKGVLLYGPPGTGKTMLAKAFAAESHATYIALEGNQFYKGVVGQGAEMVHRVFAAARRYAPSVIFIDEIDTIARARSGRDTDMAQDSEQILTALFAEMDGFSSDATKPVFVLGATNYSVEPGAKMSLDPAMLRRFDRRILIDLPNLDNRKRYLERICGEREIFHISSQGISSLADRSAGMSIAQLSSVLDLAIRTAMQGTEDYVDDAALNEALEKYTSGESKTWGQEIMLQTARHEAGHALISWFSGEKPSFVTIVSRSNYGGYMQYSSQEERFSYSKRELLSRIRTALGGRAAEIVYYGKESGITTGASGDLATATTLAKRMLCTYGMDRDFGMAVVEDNSPSLAPEVRQRVNQLLEEQLALAIDVIEKHKTVIDEITSRLMLQNSLRADELEQLFAKTVKAQPQTV